MVTCYDLFSNSTAVKAYTQMYVAALALSLQIPVAAVTLQTITCNGSIVPATGFSSSSSSGVVGLLPNSTFPLIMTQQLGTAPDPNLMLDGLALLLLLADSMSRFFNVPASVSAIVVTNPQGEGLFVHAFVLLVAYICGGVEAHQMSEMTHTGSTTKLPCLS